MNGTFFLYGEYHGRGHNEGPSSPLPKLSVYTSTDMDTWSFRGLLHNNPMPTWGPVPAKHAARRPRRSTVHTQPQHSQRAGRSCAAAIHTAASCNAACLPLP